MTRNSTKPTVTVKEFPGLSTTNDAFDVGHTGLMQADNVDITRTKKITRRTGATLKLPMPGITAAWADDDMMLLVSGSSLIRVDPDYSVTTVRADLTPSDRLVAKNFNGRTYYSNGIETGVIYDNRDHRLGIEHAPAPDIQKYAIGKLPAGRYQVAITYERSDGFESGCGIGTVFVLDESERGLRIAFQRSDDPDVTRINIYVTRPNGTELYFAMQEPNINSVSMFTEHPDTLQRALRTQFRVPPPPFTGIETNDRRMLYAFENNVIVSDPFAPEHVLEGEAYFPFTGAIQTIAAGPDTGIFVGTDIGTYYMEGDTLDKIEMSTLAHYGTVRGTVTYVDASLLGEGDVSGILPVWMSAKGLCVGMPDGMMRNITERSVDIPKGVSGTAMFRQEDGQNHIISIIQTMRT